MRVVLCYPTEDALALLSVQRDEEDRDKESSDDDRQRISLSDEAPKTETENSHGAPRAPGPRFMLRWSRVLYSRKADRLAQAVYLEQREST